MPKAFTRFRIEGLHGRSTVSVPIANNRLILVGENGTGKSTVANLIYYLLTKQWRRIKEYKFTHLEADISGETVRFTHEDYSDLMAHAQHDGAELSSQII